MKLELLFGIFPYVALGLLVAGTLVRYLLLRKQDLSAEVTEAWAVFASGRLWQVSLLLLLLAHLFVLIAPRAVLGWNASSARLYVLEIMLLVVAIASLAGVLGQLWRNLKRHNGSVLAELSDTVLLALLFVGIGSGLLLSILYRWGSVWGAMVLAPYLASVFRGKPLATFVLQLPFLVRLHVFSLFAALAVVPATRLGTVVISLVRSAVSAAAKPAAAIGGAAAAWLRKHNPAPLFWPEED